MPPLAQGDGVSRHAVVHGLQQAWPDCSEYLRGVSFETGRRPGTRVARPSSVQLPHLDSANLKLGADVASFLSDVSMQRAYDLLTPDGVEPAVERLVSKLVGNSLVMCRLEDARNYSRLLKSHPSIWCRDARRYHSQGDAYTGPVECEDDASSETTQTVAETATAAASIHGGGLPSEPLPPPERAAPSGGKKRRAASKKSPKRPRLSSAGDSEDEDEGGVENSQAWEVKHLLPELARGGADLLIQRKDAPRSVQRASDKLQETNNGQDVHLLSLPEVTTSTKMVNHLLLLVPKGEFVFFPRLRKAGNTSHIWILTASAMRQVTQAAHDGSGNVLTPAELNQRIARRAESITMQKRGYTRCDKCHTSLVPHDHPQYDQLMRDGDERAVVASTGLTFETCETCKQLSCPVLPNTPPRALLPAELRACAPPSG